MFNDLNKFEANFIEADLLNIDANPELTAMKGTLMSLCSTITSPMGWGKQAEACKRVVEMSTNGAMVVGIHVDGRLEHLKTDKVNYNVLFS